jgi:hypothetical protein
MLCPKCGNTGHKANACEEVALPAWECCYLQALCFGSDTGLGTQEEAQARFASKKFGVYDRPENLPYGSPGRMAPPPDQQGPPQLPLAAPPAPPGPSASADAKAITWSVPTASPMDTPTASFPPPKFTPPIATLDAFLGESSRPNKRAHFEDSEETVEQSSYPAPPLQNLPPFTTMRPPPQPAPRPFFPGDIGEDMGMPDADLGVVKPKRKPRDTSKPVDVPILMGHVDEKSGMMESAVSLRKILKETHFDISLLDYFSWSPLACTEMRRLLQRAVKAKKGKGRGKGKGKATANSAVPHASESLVPNGNSADLTPPSLDPSFAGPFVASAQSAAIAPDTHTKFLSSLSQQDRAYRITATIRVH